MPPASSRTAALVMLAYAQAATLPRTRSAAQACNAALSRTRDFLMHAPARDVAIAGSWFTPAEFNALRGPALQEMRARCQACGLCRLVGHAPP
jgi:hypothetical protein